MRYLGWVHATITEVYHDRSRVDIRLDNGDEFKDCVLGVPLGTRESSNGYLQVCKTANVIAFKGYGSDWLVAFEDSQKKKPSTKTHNEVHYEYVLDAIRALADGLQAGAESNCVNGSPLTKAAEMIIKVKKANYLADKIERTKYRC